MEVIVLEHHPNDSRILVKEDGICQSLTSRMGTGGGNVPLVLTFTEKRYGEYHEDDKGITLRSKSATCGGWSEVLVVEVNRNNSRPPDTEDK